MNIYIEYAKLEAQIGELEAKKKSLRLEIMTQMQNEGSTKKMFDYGSFSQTSRAKWTYGPLGL